MKIEEIELYGRKNIKVFSNRPQNLVEVLENSVVTFREKAAVVSEEKALTYAQLDKYSTIIAANLQKECSIK